MWNIFPRPDLTDLTLTDGEELWFLKHVQPTLKKQKK